MSTTNGDAPILKDDPRHMEREADWQLRGKVEEWPEREGRTPSPKGVWWVSVLSPPGQGNTSLLRHLAFEELKSAKLTNLRRIFIGGRDSEENRQPHEYLPFANAFARELRRSRSTMWERLRLFFRRATLRSTLLGCVAGGAWLALSIASDASSTANGAATNWQAYLSRNWKALLLKLVMSGALALLASLASKAFGKKESQQERLSASEERELKTEEGLLHAIEDLCHGSDRLLLIVDDTDALPESEHLFLYSIAEKGLRQNRSWIPVLVVALEPHEKWNSDLQRLGTHYEAVTPEPLTRPDLREIAQRHLDEAVISGGDLEKTVEDALEGGVKMLFRESENRLELMAGREFERLRAASVPGKFQRAEEISYLAAAHTSIFERREIAAIFADPLLQEHLKECGYSESDARPELAILKDGANPNGIVRASDTRFVYFDVLRCEAWCRFLARHEPQLLQQAHYFWCRRNGRRWREDTNSSRWLLNAAWHAAEASQVVQPEPEATRAMLAWLRTGEETKEQRAAEVFELLLEASVICRERGELKRSNESAKQAAGWSSGKLEQVERLGNELWENYWERGGADVRNQLDDLARKFPMLAESPWWLGHAKRFLCITGVREAGLSQAQTDVSDAELRNLHLLADTLLLIRRTLGFRADALADRSVPLALPAESTKPFRSELPLLDLAAEAFVRRGDDQFLSVLARYYSALQRAQSGRMRAAKIAAVEYYTARYWTHLVEASRRAGSSPDPESAMASIRAAALEPLPQELTLESHLVPRAAAAYDRANRLASLVDSRRILNDISFDQGAFLKEFGSRDAGEKDSPWWNTWDQLFTTCVGLERELGWVIQSPGIHRTRWHFFKDLDEHAALKDAYNTLADTYRARYSQQVLLDTLFDVARFLSRNAADDYEQNRRAAVLLELCADRLSARGAKTRRFMEPKDLRIEQAYCLGFAVGCWLKANHLDRAQRVLDRVARLIGIFGDAAPEDQPFLHRVRVLWSVQNADLCGVRELTSEYRAAVRQTWALLEKADREYALVLTRLAKIEDKEGTLDSEWPEGDNMPQTDPLNPALSLPDEFVGDGPLDVIRTRLEFRVCQLAAPLFTNLAEAQKSDWVSAAQQWSDYDRLGEGVLWFAERATQSEVGPEAAIVLKGLLWATWHYFSGIVQSNAEELETLELLVKFDADSETVRETIGKVIREIRELLVHELQLNEQQEKRDWASTAEIFRRRFRLLIDRIRLASNLTNLVVAAGISPLKFNEEHQARATTLEKAEKEFTAGNFESCFRLLTPVLPAYDTPVTLYEGIWVLDLWLRCEKEVHRATPAEREKRAAQLRAAALQYCRLLAQSLESEELQGLANELLDDLGRGQSNQSSGVASE